MTWVKPAEQVSSVARLLVLPPAKYPSQSPPAVLLATVVFLSVAMVLHKPPPSLALLPEKVVLVTYVLEAEDAAAPIASAVAEEGAVGYFHPARLNVNATTSTAGAVTGEGAADYVQRGNGVQNTAAVVGTVAREGAVGYGEAAPVVDAATIAGGVVREGAAADGHGAGEIWITTTPTSGVVAGEVLLATISVSSLSMAPPSLEARLPK